MHDRAFVVANPTSAAGAVRREWDALERLLKQCVAQYDVAFTQGKEHATLLTQEALRAGWPWIIAVGGDGTINEVVNGFFARSEPLPYDVSKREEFLSHDLFGPPEPIKAGAHLSVVPIGTGGDFRRTLGLMGSWRESLAILQRPKARQIDVGELVFTNHNGQIDRRMFINVASAGLAGNVDALANSMNKRLGGTLTFGLASLAAFASWKNVAVDMQIDGLDERTESLITCAVANGQYFGGGMWVAPGASITDGHLQMVVISEMPKRKAIGVLAKIYAGTHLNEPGVWRRDVSQVSMKPNRHDEVVLIDVDGEQPG